MMIARLLPVWILYTLCAFPSMAQNYWGRLQGGANVDETLAIASDGSGNSYATGYFSTTAQVNNTGLNSAGLTDVFVVKAGPNGNTQWAIAAGGAQSDRGLGIAVDPAGNVLVCGFFTGSINFGNGVSLTANSNSQDAFVVKYNANGQAQWARAGGSAGSSDRANAVATDASGNVYITGQFTGQASFGGISVTATGTTNDVFIAKYNPAGDEQWVRTGAGNGLNRGLSITTDTQGAIYTTGQFSGDITFDNAHPNTIQNATFIVKYLTDGTESWFRFAGGTAQSIGYGIASDGTNVYLAGDCGQSLTFLGGGATNVLTTGYANAVFLVAISTSGGYLWGRSQGSASGVSARGVSVRGGQVGVAGWFECTFQSLAAEYGAGTFNNVGFKDLFVMRYTTAGAFLWARQFASRTDEVANGLAILPDNQEVIAGSFQGEIYIPIRNSLNASGLVFVNESPNPATNYCGDAFYGQYSKLNGSGGLDGFMLKTVDLERRPYDFYKRYPGACNADVPPACIALAGALTGSPCQNSFIACPPYSIQATPYTNFHQNVLGYAFNVQWNTGASGNPLAVTAPGTVSATITSVDGCYTTTASATVNISPPADKPTISDNAGVNTQALNPAPIFICPGESVDLWFQTNPNYTFNWTGSNVTAGQANQPVITVNQPGVYQINVTSPDGCSNSNFVTVVLYPPPPNPLDPYLFFPSDTVVQCQGSPAAVFVYDHFTDTLALPMGYIWQWTVTPSGFAGGSSQGFLTVNQSGTYTISVQISPIENLCALVEESYQISGTIYVEIVPPPQVNLVLTAPAATCGDPVVIVIETNADELTFNQFVPVTIWGTDSILVSGAGTYNISGMATNAQGCSASASQTVTILQVENPDISTFPNNIICPGESVTLSTDAPGTVQWQGPSGNAGTGSSIVVDEPGFYYAEVFYYPGCELVSNTVQVAEYATPFASSSNAVLCPGDSVIITIITTDLGGLVWLPPLSGSDTLQIITQPGVYTAIVTSCGIQTTVQVEVALSGFGISASQADPTPVCQGDSILLVSTPGYLDYQWNNGSPTTDVYVFASGSYQVVAVDPNGCPISSNVVQVNFEPIPPIPGFNAVPVCFGDAQTVTVDAGPFTATWFDLSGNELFAGNGTTINPFVADTSFVVILSSQWCTGDQGGVLLSPKPLPDNPIPFTDAPVCVGTTLNLEVANAVPGVNYFWIAPNGNALQGGTTSASVSNLTWQGTYLCYAVLDGCLSDTTDTDVALFVPRQVALPPDTTLCLQNTLVLITDTIFQGYLWQDGSTGDTYTATETGAYFVQATDFNGCKSVAFVNLDMVDCNVIIPNVFTPNSDGMNDQWFIFTDRPQYFRIIVYNRWGNLVYESTQSSKMWDGNHYRSGEPCTEGVYFYIAEIRSFDGVDFGKTGSVTLIRE